MTLPLQLRPNLPTGGCFTAEQLREIAASLQVELPADTRLVQFSPTPPACTTLPWQPTDQCGGYPVGVDKFFKGGAWK